MSDGKGKTATAGREYSALKHPLFWVALLVLVFNDHFFKGGDLLPGWLTGKLSDFAGLIVAPLVLAALLRAKTDRRRAFAFLIVGGWFVSANLFHPVAAATSAFAELIGLSWTFWVDPTDLVALAVLPVTWTIASSSRPLTGGRLAERLALGFGVAACIASPPPEPSWNTNAFIVNDTADTIDLRVRWVEASVDCESLRGRYADALPRDSFGAGTVFRMAPRTTLPLDRGIAMMGGFAWDVMETPTSHTGTCDIIMISADGLPETVVYWEDLAPHVIPDVIESTEDGRAVESGMRLEHHDGEMLTLIDGAGYGHTAPVEFYDGGVTCRDYGSVTGFDWSDMPAFSGELVRITDVRPTIDDCVQVSFERHSYEEQWDSFICVPPTDFPFLPNSLVTIWNSPGRLRILRVLRLDDGTEWRTGELIISRGVSVLREGPFDLELVQVDSDCAGVRMGCGGFRVPAAGGLTMGGTTRYVHPGDVVERDAADGRRARLRVGRAEAMWATHEACGAGRDQLGPRLEALVVYGEDSR